MANEMEVLELEDIASLLGVSERMIRNYIKDNALPCRNDGRKRVFVWDEVREWYVAYRIAKDGSRGSLSTQVPVKEDINAASLRKTVAEADLKELQLAKERGQVAAIDDVERILSAANMATQTQILAVPSRLATQMLGLEDHGRAVSILEAEMRQLLSNLATIDAVKESVGLQQREDDDE
jgi:phage terminase Nu1 subunit (DNA packaging protein)